MHLSLIVIVRLGVGSRGSWVVNTHHDRKGILLTRCDCILRVFWLQYGITVNSASGVVYSGCGNGVLNWLVSAIADWIL
jgi:hypothetical protein